MPMTTREAIKLILKQGGQKVRSGAKHDVYIWNGQIIAVPRHRGDLSPGVERQIRDILGE